MYMNTYIYTYVYMCVCVNIHTYVYMERVLINFSLQNKAE